MESKKLQIRNVLSKCFSKDGEQFPPTLELDKITKIQFSSYTSDDVFTMSLFIASNAKNANNKPYTYSNKLSIDQIITFKSIIKEVVTADAQDMDLFLNTPHETVTTEQTESTSILHEFYNNKAPSTVVLQADTKRVDTVKPVTNRYKQTGFCNQCGNEVINGDCGGKDCI